MTTSIRALQSFAFAASMLIGTGPVLFAQVETETSADTLGAGIVASAADEAIGTGSGAEARTQPAESGALPFDATAHELPFRDNTPLVTVDGRMMFFNSTRRGDRSWGRIVQDGSRWDDDIYVRMRDGAGDGPERWLDPVNLGPSVNSGADDGVATISANGTRMYLVSMRSGWERGGGPFFVAELAGTAVTSLEGMGGGIARFFAGRDRSRNFHIYGAAIDAYEETFYFATTVRSRRGEQEIWVSRRIGSEWGDPVNLGPEVNAPGGSYSPFIAADGATLYFSSGRAGGLGGDDIYRTTLDSNGLPRAVVNLGPTINSDGDEAFFSIPASGERVYLSSSKGGVESLVAAPLEAWMRPGGVAVLSGTVVDAATRQPIAATVRIEDLATDSIVYVGRTSDLDDRYSTVLRPGRSYGISISAPGYVFTSTHYAIGDTIDYLELSRNFELAKIDVNESFTLHNIFFDYNSAELDPTSANELRRLGTLLAERGELRIEVGGHTDNIGSDEFNDDLSARRARAVRDYLVGTCGVAPRRVMSRGYGAGSPVASNETEEGRQANRRVTFTIVAM